MTERNYALILVFFLGITLMFSPGVHAAYNRPVNLESIRPIKFEPILRDQITSSSNLYDPVISNELINNILNDFQQRISADFKIPQEIKNNVEFWFKIYTLYSSRQVVLFNAKHPEIIYDVIDLREVAENAKNQLIYEVISKNKIKKSLQRYKNAFAKLCKNPRPKFPSTEEKNILFAHKQLHHRHSFEEMSKSLRTQTGQRDNVIRGLTAAEPYVPKMEVIFEKMGLPKELVRLSLVESSFSFRVVSRAGAAGVWQFMPRSGKEYLLIDHKHKIDERLSPLKSTVAAAKLLKRNYKTLNSWVLAITSYNHGIRHLRKISARGRSFNYFASYFETCPRSKLKPTLGWASKNYFSEFLALLYAESYSSSLFGQFPAPLISPLAFQPLPTKTSALEFTMSRGISLFEFRRLNPDIQDIHAKLPAGFVVAIPASPSQSDDFSILTRKPAASVRFVRGLDLDSLDWLIRAHDIDDSW